MTDLPPISDETLEVLKKIPTQTLIDGLWVKGWPMSYIEDAMALQEGQHMAGRAVTLLQQGGGWQAQMRPQRRCSKPQPQ